MQQLSSRCFGMLSLGPACSMCLQNFTHFVVYTKSSFAEQTTPNSLSFEEAVAKYQVGSDTGMHGER